MKTKVFFFVLFTMISTLVGAQTQYEVESQRKKAESEVLLSAVIMASTGLVGSNKNYTSPDYQVLALLPALQLSIIHKATLVQNLKEIEKKCLYGHDFAIMTPNKCSYYICKTPSEKQDYYYFCYNKPVGEISNDNPKKIEASYDRDRKLKSIYDEKSKSVRPSNASHE